MSRDFFLAVLAMIGLTACDPALFVWPGGAGEIVVGGQESIDAGNITNFNGCDPDADCTVWLTGHNTSNDGVFGTVPNIRVGDTLQILDEHNHVYRVTKIVVEYDGRGAITGDLVVQTSLGDVARLLVYAEEISADLMFPMDIP